MDNASFQRSLFLTFDLDIFTVGDGGGTNSILGWSFFASYHIVLDRTNMWVSFQRGCGCETGTDIYPLVEFNGTATSNTATSTKQPSTAQENDAFKPVLIFLTLLGLLNFT